MIKYPRRKAKRFTSNTAYQQELRRWRVENRQRIINTFGDIKMGKNVTRCTKCGGWNWAYKEKCVVCGGKLEPTFSEVYNYFMNRKNKEANNGAV